MIITLKGANFSTNNIGTLSTWTISRILGNGATYSGDSYVDKGAALNAIVTIADGYELGSAGVIVTMGGVAVTSSITVNGNTITISIGSITGNVVIKVPTVNINTGEEDGGGSGSGDITVTNPLEHATFMENTLVNASDGATADSDIFYSYIDVPVNEGDTYIIPCARNVVFFDENKAYLGWVNLTSLHVSENGYADNTLIGKYPYVVKIPAGTKYINYCVKYEEFSNDKAFIGYPNTDGSYTIDEIVVDTKDATHGIYPVVNHEKLNILGIYYTVASIPVIGGKTYTSEFGRNYVIETADHQFISFGTFKDGDVTMPSEAAYITVSFRNEEVSKENAKITIIN